jgi:pyruvate kinase
LLKPHKGMNLPGVALSTPALTDKDKEDLAFGVAHSVDYVALSFVRTPNDLAITKDHIRSLGRAIPVIAKIEKREAIDALDAIIAAADGVMVARGDLGVELSTEEVPSLQKRIIAAANATGRVVITATQMLESMIESPRPTRAEASDVANAILDGTDAVMLSAETASGRFPVEAVETMARVALYTEEHQQQRAPEDVTGAASRVASSLAHVAKHVAADLGCRLIVVFTSSGLTAQLVAAYRPRVPIAALTPSEGSYRRLALWRGVIPLRAPITQTTDEMLARGENILCASGLARAGDTVVMLAGQALSAGATNMLRVHTL